MNLFADIRALVIECLDAMVAAGELPEGLDFANVAVEPPRDAAHGDMATNAAMVLAKPAGQNPRAIAEALAGRLGADGRIELAEVAGPGFLNLRLSALMWQGVVRHAITESGFGRSTMGKGEKVNVEFVSANPTGPMHVGHVRGAVVGDALSNLLAFAGWNVTREYYINDFGNQVGLFADSVRAVHEGKELEFLLHDQNAKEFRVRGRVIRSGHNPGGQPAAPIVEVDGRLRFSLPGEPLFPALTDDAILRPTLSWRLAAPQAVACTPMRYRPLPSSRSTRPACCRLPNMRQAVVRSRPLA